MTIYLGLGSNLGDRRGQLSAAIDALAQSGVAVVRVSPIVESSALLPRDAPADWNKPFLNLVLECRSSAAPGELLHKIKDIEASLGRRPTQRWAPRPIDIDILLWDDFRIVSDTLEIPHPALTTRNFVLSPLLALHPSLVLPNAGKTVLEHVRELGDHIPLWMGIVNLTPDSFSDGGELKGWETIEAHIDTMWNAGAHIIDFGAESTRPGAIPLSADDELARLMSVLELVTAKYAGQRLRPLISVDTYHSKTAEHAIALGVDVINDVSGLTAPGMMELAATRPVDWIAMHHVTIPVDASRTLPQEADACAEVERWLEQQLEQWTRAGLNLDRILFDPGIGFGKNSLQSLALLRNMRRFQRYGLRCVVGHSRKSFMHAFSARDHAERDLTTIGASLKLCAQGIDVLRVHNVPAHVAAYRGWAHV